MWPFLMSHTSFEFSNIYHQSVGVLSAQNHNGKPKNVKAWANYKFTTFPSSEHGYWVDHQQGGAGRKLRSRSSSVRAGSTNLGGEQLNGVPAPRGVAAVPFPAAGPSPGGRAPPPGGRAPPPGGRRARRAQQIERERRRQIEREASGGGGAVS
jgi:hypothetical protein